MRPTKLPSFRDEFGRDGRTFAGVRQTRFGVKGFQPTNYGELKTTFEFELFGVGVDTGQTTFRLRHAYGELGHFGAGQTWSPFMDIDVFPNSIEYWGPNGMAFFRNVQVRGCPFRVIRGSRLRSRDRVQVRIREGWKIGSKSQTFLRVSRFRIFPVNSGGAEKEVISRRLQSSGTPDWMTF